MALKRATDKHLQEMIRGLALAFDFIPLNSDQEYKTLVKFQKRVRAEINSRNEKWQEVNNGTI